MYGVFRVTSLLLSDFDKISQISQSQNGRISFLKKKKSHPSRLKKKKL